MIETILESILHWEAVFLLIGLINGMVLFHYRQRRMMMGAKAAGDYCYTIYFFLMNAHAGAFGAGIAATGSLVQALTPDQWMDRTKYARLTAACFLAVVGIYVTAQKTTDLLPLLAIIAGRFVELSSSAQKIRIGMLCTFPPWVIYNYSHDLYLLVVANVIIGTSLAWAIWKHRPLPVVAPEG